MKFREKLRDMIRPFVVALLMLALFLGTPVVANDGEGDLVVPVIQQACITMLQTNERCDTLMGQFSWWYLDCDNVVKPTPPPCDN